MDSFDQLLSPFDVNTFFHEYWERQPLYVSGEESKFASFPNLKELPSMLTGSLSGSRWTTKRSPGAQASFLDHAGNVRNLSAPISSMWPDLFNAGASLCFSAVDQCHDSLTRFVRGIAATTQLPGNIVTTCYLTPPSSGSAMHFDSQHVFFMQVAGKKHWKIGTRPGWQDAPTNVSLASLETPDVKTFLDSIGVTIAKPDDTALQEITLNTGDVLYMPPGVWHQGRTSDSHSLHYTLTFAPLTPWHFVAAYLRRQMFEKPALRRDLRYVSESNGSGVTEAIEAAILELKKTVERLEAKDLEECFAKATATNGTFRDHLLQP